MATCALYCAGEDRHRVVLLVDFFAELGLPCQLVTEPGGAVGEPAMIVWTQTSSTTPWLRHLFEADGEQVALVLDLVALPPGCGRAVDLSNWPARSADGNIKGLARWLRSSHPGGSFGTATVRRLSGRVAAGKRTSSGARSDVPSRSTWSADSPNPWVVVGGLLLAAAFLVFLHKIGGEVEDKPAYYDRSA